VGYTYGTKADFQADFGKDGKKKANNDCTIRHFEDLEPNPTTWSYVVNVDPDMLSVVSSDVGEFLYDRKEMSAIVSSAKKTVRGKKRRKKPEWHTAMMAEPSYMSQHYDPQSSRSGAVDTEDTERSTLPPTDEPESRHEVLDPNYRRRFEASPYRPRSTSPVDEYGNIPALNPDELDAWF
jgi:hypothetical protein